MEQLSIIINHYKIPNLLVRCIESIIKKIKNIDYEIIIADSGAEHTTYELLKQKFKNLKNLKYFGFKKNVGFAKSINPAIKKAKFDFILIINADIIIRSEKCLLSLIKYFKAHKDTGLIAPKLLNIDGSFQQSFFREPGILSILARRTLFKNTFLGKKALNYYEYKNYNFKKPLEVDWLMGSCLLTKKQYLKKVGYFDERYFLYFEDVDLARKIRKILKLKVIFYPYCSFLHYHIRASLKRGIKDIFTNKYTRIHILSYIKYILKWKILKII